MTENEKVQVEINGVKMELDLRTARRIETLRVGSRVKVLIKDYSGYKVYPGTVVGFEPFEKLPTIVVAYLESNWQNAELKFLYYNTQSKDCEIVASVDEVPVDRVAIEKAFDAKIGKLRREIEEIEERRGYFRSNFAAYWEKMEVEKAG